MKIISIAELFDLLKTVGADDIKTIPLDQAIKLLDCKYQHRSTITSDSSIDDYKKRAEEICAYQIWDKDQALVCYIKPSDMTKLSSTTSHIVVLNDVKIEDFLVA